MSTTCFINTCTLKHLLSQSLLRIVVGLLESKIVFHYHHISFANTDIRTTTHDSITFYAHDLLLVNLLSTSYG